MEIEKEDVVVGIISKPFIKNFTFRFDIILFYIINYFEYSYK